MAGVGQPLKREDHGRKSTPIRNDEPQPRQGQDTLAAAVDSVADVCDLRRWVLLPKEHLPDGIEELPLILPANEATQDVERVRPLFLCTCKGHIARLRVDVLPSKSSIATDTGGAIDRNERRRRRSIRVECIEVRVQVLWLERGGRRRVRGGACGLKGFPHSLLVGQQKLPIESQCCGEHREAVKVGTRMVFDIGQRPATHDRQGLATAQRRVRMQLEETLHHCLHGADEVGLLLPGQGGGRGHHMSRSSRAH